MINFVQSSMILHTILADTVKGGDLVIIGNLVGIAVSDGDGASLRAVHLQGVYRLPKDASTFTQGDSVYWDDTAKKATSTSTDNTLMGVAFASEAVLTGDIEMEVALMNNL